MLDLNTEILGDQLMSEDIKMLKEIFSQLERPINRSAAQLSDLHDSLKREFWKAKFSWMLINTGEERLEIFRWLSTVPHRSHHENTGNDFLPQSGQWLLQKGEFIEWRKSSVSSILWLHGIRMCPRNNHITPTNSILAGSGKSKLV